MDLQNEKCVLIIDEALPLGNIANTAAVLGITLGMKMPEIVGPEVIDGSGNIHMGVTAANLPILKGTEPLLKEMRTKLYEPEFEDVTVVDFSATAQSCTNYGDYTAKIAGVPASELSYFGIAIYGPKKKVNKLTGSMPLLR